MPASLLPQIAEPLLAWYDRHKRAMPWRDSPNPYRVWVSEIMLQQTRVETVIPYFERFLASLPDISALAAAPEDQLLKLWEGLGYYSRARNLQRAARMVMEEHGGQLPADPTALMRLPGIGAYTAGAIASIAFGIPAPAVDGNVLRVVTRLAADPSDIGSEAFRREVADRLLPLIPPERPGDFTQAVMELGAVVCLPRPDPLCGECPLSDMCLARRQGNPGDYPNRPSARPRKEEILTVFALASTAGILVRRRPAAGLLAGMWELPHLPGQMGPDEALAAIQAWGAIPEKRQGLSPLPLPVHKHVFSHREWRMTGYGFRTGPFEPPTGWRWVPMEELRENYAFSAAFYPYLRECDMIGLT